MNTLIFINLMNLIQKEELIKKQMNFMKIIKDKSKKFKNHSQINKSDL
jgi:hypothetical protein